MEKSRTFAPLNRGQHLFKVAKYIIHDNIRGGVV